MLQLPILIADDFPPQFGGIQRYMACLAAALHRLALNVVVIAPHTEGALEYDGTLPYRVIRYRGKSRISKVINIARACLAIKGDPRDYMLAALWFPSGLAAALISRITHLRLGILIHGSEITKARGFRSAIMRAVLRGSYAVIANSNFTRDLLYRTGYHGPVHVNNCGVEPFDGGSERSVRPTILSVGRLVRRKGFDVLLEAMSSTLRAFPEAICEIAGDGEDRFYLENLAETLGISASVRFLGAIDDVDLRNAYGRAWCFAMPARRYGDDVEGFGIVYLEAAIAGIPPIGGRESGASDAIAHGETGYIVDGTDAATLAATIEYLFDNPEFGIAMGLRARFRALAAYSWEANATRLNRIMQSYEHI